ncbi:MAG: hypothetical protein V4651_02600 [Bacteroidota bacterium]
MRKIAVLGLLFVGCMCTVQGQALKTWFGEWKGSLELYKPDGSIDKTVPMDLLIKPTADSLAVQWRITYNKQDVRDYSMRTDDASAGKFVLDEKNGISIDVRRFGNVLLSSFEVQDYQISDSYEMRGVTMIFTLTSSSTNIHTRSGKGTEQSPTVKSMPLNVFQRAVLFRQ